jgi:hypothetical protein
MDTVIANPSVGLRVISVRDLGLTESPPTMRISNYTWIALPPLDSRRFFQKLSNIGLPSFRGHVSLVSLEAEMRLDVTEQIRQPLRRR